MPGMRMVSYVGICRGLARGGGCRRIGEGRRYQTRRWANRHDCGACSQSWRHVMLAGNKRRVSNEPSYGDGRQISEWHERS